MQILDRRRIEVFRTLGDDDAANAVLRNVTPIPIEQLVSDFLREYRDGALPGRKPSSGTVDLCISHLLGARGGLLGFARSTKRTPQHPVRCDRRSRDGSRQRAGGLSNDSLRMKVIVARHLARYAHGRGLLRPEALQAVLALRPPASARGRAQVDGVPRDARSRAPPRRASSAPYRRRGGPCRGTSWPNSSSVSGFGAPKSSRSTKRGSNRANARIVVRVSETSIRSRTRRATLTASTA